MRHHRVSTAARDSLRLAEIVRTLSRHGFGVHVGPRWPEAVRRHAAHADPAIAEHPAPVRLRLALTELGTTFVKLGQILSTRPDLVGAEMARELAKLQDDVPAEPFDEVQSVIEAELGRPLAELFARIDERPAGSASIAQVHPAELPDGARVAVKVQHAGIEARIHEDLDIVAFLAGLAEDHSAELRQYKPRALVAAFRRTLLRELDFVREAANLERFRRNFAEDPTVTFPRPYAGLSSRRVLTMQLLEGTSLAHLDVDSRHAIDGREIGARGARVWLEMVFRDGFVHADPHPGNILVLPGQRLGVIDCGMVVPVDDETREDFEDFVMAYITGDVDQLTSVILRMCATPADLDRRTFRADVDDLLSAYENVPLGSMDAGALVGSLAELVRRYQLVLPERMSLLLKVVAQLEGTSRLLDEDFRLTELLRDFSGRLLAQRYAPARLLRRLGRARRDWEHALGAFPGALAAIEERVRDGRIEIQHTHRRLDRIVNRVVYGLIVAALLVGSTLLWSRDAPPMVGDVSIVGVVGFAVAVLLGVRLVWAIYRSEGL